MKKYILSLILLFLIILAGFSFLKSRSPENPVNTVPQPSPSLTSEISTGRAIGTAFSQKYHRPADVFTIEVITDTGAFAKGSVRFQGEMGGGLWFGARTKKGWELAYDGNGIIDCASANKYHFPANLVPSCIDTQKSNTLIKR